MSLEQTFTSKLTLENSKNNKQNTSGKNSAASVTSAAAAAQKSSTFSSSSASIVAPAVSSSASSTTSTTTTTTTSSSNRPILSRVPSKRGPSPLRSQLSRTNSTTSVLAGPTTPSTPTAPPSLDRIQSARVTRKIFHNWRSACGRTKDRTKDLFRRWKTLPEDHPDFDKVPKSQHQTLQQTQSTAGVVTGSAASSTSSSSSVLPRGSTSNSANIPSSTSSSVHHADLHGGSGGGPLSKIKSIAKKTSESELNPLNRSASVCHDDTSGPMSGATGNSSSKPSAGWTVHVWATYVQRGDGEDEGIDNEEAPPGRDFLSDFQKIKLTHFFRHVLDMNHDDVISATDFVALNQRIRHYIEWSSECIEFHILKEVHSGFLECFLNQSLDECSHMYYVRADRETKEHVNVDEWLDVWGELLNKVRHLESLPLWLQYFPKILFQVINKSGSGTITKEDLRAFYTSFLGIDFRVVNDTLDSIYKAMTDGSRTKLDYNTFKLCFANFLLGKYPHGPGQFLFGICSPQSLSCSFPIDYSALNTSPDDLEPYTPRKVKDQSDRRSVIV